jgi:hypothetical protein
MKNAKNSRYIFQMIVHCQRTRDQHGNGGYALLVTSILAILTFSMLSVFLFSTNLYKSVANTVLDSGTTFYAAETAMNKRAYAVRQKFVGYERPVGTSPGLTTNTVAEQMAICIAGAGNVGTQDMGCLTQSIGYTAAVVEYDSQGRLIERTKGKKTGNNFVNSNDTDNVQYRTYSFVRDITGYNPDGTVDLTRIKEGDYTGLNAQEYKYRVYTTAAKETNLGVGINKDVASQTMLQMDFSSRLIPIFQFAAYYDGDLEISSSTDMSLDGPVHTNSNLRLAPGGLLTFNGKVTSSGQIWKSLPYRAIHSTAAPFTETRKIKVTGGSGTLISANNAWSSSKYNVEADSRIMGTELTSQNNMLKENQPKLKLPKNGLLNRAGDFYKKGDMVVSFDPLNTTKPIESIKAFGLNFTDSMLKSLQQPVLAIVQKHGNDNGLSEVTRLCPRDNASSADEPDSLADITPAMNGTDTATANTIYASSQANKDTLAVALQTAMVDSATPITSFSSTKLAASGDLKTNLENALPATLAGINKATISSTPLNVLAYAVGGCYLPAPMQVLDDPSTDINNNIYIERREGRRIMKILQSNIKSLAVWNRDGRYLVGSTLTSADGKLFPRSSVASLAIPKEIPDGGTLPTATTISKSATTCDYTCMGLGSLDNTNNGLVWHFSMKLDYTSPVKNYTAKESPYGFAFSGGTRLPGALTIASDQAIYVQGDYNNPSNVEGDRILDATGNTVSSLDFSATNTTMPSREKKPASFLGDTITILSNSCLSADKKLNCFKLQGGNVIPVASSTVVRAAFLGGTPATVDANEISGGLNNYMRMMEDWGGKVFKYRGSFVSFGVPEEFSGKYRYGTTGTGAPTPTLTTGAYYNVPGRDFGFDTDFNSQAGLPPLTPRVVYLKQKVFKRDYDRTDRSGTK